MRRDPPPDRAAAPLPTRTVTHDIRNSLATIKIAVQTVAAEKLSERALLRLRIAEREIETIDSLLETLSDTLKAGQK